MRIRLRWAITTFWCLGLLMLAACAPGGSRTAGNTSPGQASPTASVQRSPTATATSSPSATPGSQALNGCSTASPPADAQKPADVVVTLKGTGNEQPVTLNKGQTLEVRLLATARWHMNVQNSSSALGTQEAIGWYNASLKSCIWRFTAVGAGTATLVFTGIIICPPKDQCPVAALDQQYDITVR